MSVICAACHTENRDNARFCRGCAGKLPAFAATGAAARDIRSAGSTASTAGGETSPGGLLQIHSRAFWLRLGLLALGITIGFVGWYVHVTRRTAPPAAALAAAAAPVKPAPVRAPVPAADTLAPGETLAPAGAAATASTATATATTATVQQLPPAAAVAPLRETHRRETLAARTRPDPFQAVDAPPARSASTSDPRPACAHLNFIAAARCEAAQCQKAPYRTHPHCDAVREQTRRDIARRNLPG